MTASHPSQYRCMIPHVVPCCISAGGRGFPVKILPVLCPARLKRIRQIFWQSAFKSAFGSAAPWARRELRPAKFFKKFLTACLFGANGNETSMKGSMEGPKNRKRPRFPSCAVTGRKRGRAVCCGVPTLPRRCTCSGLGSCSRWCRPQACPAARISCSRSGGC